MQLSQQDLDYGFTQDDVDELMDFWDEWVYGGEIHKTLRYKTEVILCAVSEDAVIHKVGKLYGYAVSIRSIKEISI